MRVRVSLDRCKMHKVLLTSSTSVTGVDPITIRQSLNTELVTAAL